MGLSVMKTYVRLSPADGGPLLHEASHLLAAAQGFVQAAAALVAAGRIPVTKITSQVVLVRAEVF